MENVKRKNIDFMFPCNLFQNKVDGGGGNKSNILGRIACVGLTIVGIKEKR